VGDQAVFVSDAERDEDGVLDEVQEQPGAPVRPGDEREQDDAADADGDRRQDDGEPGTLGRGR
jgi:hypothetical protein